MRRCPTPWSRRRPSARLFAGVALVLGLGACVSQGTYDELAAERDRLEAERARLSVRADNLQTSNDSLVDERETLFGEIEALRETRVTLERDVATLRRTHDQLQAALSDREGKLAEREQELAARSDALAAKEQEIARLRATYDALVGDLETEVESKRDQIERLRGGEKIEFRSDELFAPDSLELSEQGRQTLARLAERLKRISDRVEIHGHTDLVPVSGPLAKLYPSNWEIAGAMASSVARVLVDAGVEPRRVVAISHGAQVPVASNDTPDSRARNRRIEIRLVSDTPGAATATPGAQKEPAAKPRTAPAKPDAGDGAARKRPDAAVLADESSPPRP